MRYGAKLLDLERPGRYEGVEAGAVVKDAEKAPLTVALAFPDTYEIGMSHLGLRILYEILNGLDWVAAERAYAPWPDMEALLRADGLPLVTRETGRPLREFDLVGITLQYELCATNVLNMLDLGGIPVLASERGENDPIVLGGGPVAANPEPYADFFDAFFIGEAEEGIVELARALADAKASGADRKGRLAALGKVEGVYLPGAAIPRYEEGRFAGFSTPDGSAPRRVRRRIVNDLDKFPPPAHNLMAFGETVHDRLAVEVARGCTRGCRFCQAGYLYRPVREREPEQLLTSIREGVACTGHEEVGLLSLSTGDYSNIGPLTATLIGELGPAHVGVSLPSLRVDGLDPRLAAAIARVRKTGFTLAPEAGSERLRRAINKDFSDEQIIESIKRIFEAGYKGVKLYFMIGLPFEEEEDRRAINQLVRRLLGSVPGGKNRVTVSVSNFVPKPHTPFQWADQRDLDEIASAQELLRREIPGKKADLKYHDARVSRMEGILARGDRRVGQVILEAFRLGCRMDGWSSEFRADLWDKALEATSTDPALYLKGRAPGEPLPWQLIDTGIDEEYLLAEYRKAAEVIPTGDCRTGACTGCGLCDFKELRPRSAKGSLPYPELAPQAEEPASTEPEGERLRFTYSKTGPSALLSHLETSRLLLRAFRAASIPVTYSRGFNPHPKMQLGPALALGVESLCETGEMRVDERPDLASCLARANTSLPEGLKLLSLWHMQPESRTLTGGGMEEEFRLTPSPASRERLAALGGWPGAIASYRSAGGLRIIKRRKHKPDRVLEAAEFVLGLWPEGEELGLIIKRQTDGATLSPEHFTAALLGLEEGERALDRMLKTRTTIS